MKKKGQSIPINILTIVIVVIIIFLIINYYNKPKQETPEAVAKCIGEKSILYVQIGCSHCKDQEDTFGDNLKYLNIIDCFYEKDKCIEKEITGTPTWIINGEKMEGVQSIEKLKELTGC